MNEKYIVSSQIFVKWNDDPKQVRLDDEMPDNLTILFDEWLSEIEHKRNWWEKLNEKSTCVF